MSILSKTRAYLSGPMENTDGTEWRNKVKKELSAQEIRFFDPYDKPFITSLPEDASIRQELIASRSEGDLDSVAEYMKPVRSDDLRLCDICDFAIVLVHPTIASYGTAEELTTLNRMKKPIFVAVAGGRNLCPLWVLGMLKPKYIYSSIEDIISMLKRIDSGDIPIDSDRWRLLHPDYR